MEHNAACSNLPMPSVILKANLRSVFQIENKSS